NALEIAERHLAALLAATQGQNVSFPEPLNGLADWNQLAVIGHDTGAASAALMTWTRGTLGEEADVDALVLVNASAELATQNTALPDIPTLVVLGECARESRDAGTDYAGQLYFEAARQSPVRETPALSVLVEGANRNYFMTGDELLITDDYGAGFGDDTACLPESEGRLTRDQQPVLIQQLAAAFLDTVLLGQPVEANIGLDPLQPAPTEIFGFPVRTALLAPSIQRLAIMQPQTGPSVIVNALGGDVVTEGDVGIAVCLNDFACNGGLAPSGQPAAAYISSRYESSIAFTLPEPRQDLRMFDGLHFRFAFDPLSRLNAMGEKLGFEVTVTDKAGNTAVYPLPGLTPANFVAEADPVQAYTRIPNFLQSIRIDLSEFADVDLSQVESVGFRFYPLNSVAFFLADVELVRERIPAVTGTVTYADTVLPADATLNLRLVDVTQPGATAQLIAQETVEVVGKAIPFAFVLPYDPTLILPTSSYAMQASIESAAGDILLATTDTYLVLTQGNPARADLLLTSFKTTAQISGSVITNTPVTLPPGATIIVQLLDITQPTLPRLIALQTFAASEQVLPYSYALAYDPALISPAGVYALQAQVAVGDQVLLA
ncbi:MAG: YbaY family lipoprotein, partial [Anaerolineae bacterium]|nr:YbaY family lipoprotein [Anaerolineae bacterium]